MEEHPISRLQGSAGFQSEADPSLLHQIVQTTGCGSLGTVPTLRVGAADETKSFNGIELLRGIDDRHQLHGQAFGLVMQRGNILRGTDVSAVRQALVENRSNVMQLVGSYFRTPVHSVDLVGRTVYELQLYQFPQMWSFLSSHLGAGAKATDLKHPGSFERYQQCLRNMPLHLLCLDILRHAVCRGLQRIQIAESRPDLGQEQRINAASPAASNGRTDDLRALHFQHQTPLRALTPMNRDHAYRRSPPPI